MLECWSLARERCGMKLQKFAHPTRLTICILSRSASTGDRFFSVYEGCTSINTLLYLAISSGRGLQNYQEDERSRNRTSDRDMFHSNIVGQLKNRNLTASISAKHLAVKSLETINWRVTRHLDGEKASQCFGDSTNEKLKSISVQSMFSSGEPGVLNLTGESSPLDM